MQDGLTSPSNDSSASTFSIAENRLIQIEKEVAAQSEAIKKYIQNHSNATYESDNLIALRNLYNLFKKEVQFNFRIRKELSDSIQTQKVLYSENQKITQIVNGFINEINNYYNQQFQNLNDVTLFFLENIDQSIEAEKSVKLIRQFVHDQKEIKSKITNLKSSIDKCTMDINIYQSSSSQKLIELDSEIESTKILCSSLKKQIESELQIKEENLHQITLIDQSASVYIKHIEYQRHDFDMMVNNLRNKQEKRKSKLERLNGELRELKAKYKSNLAETQELQTALANTEKEKSLIDSKAKQEITEFLNQKQTYNTLLRDFHEKHVQNVDMRKTLIVHKQKLESEIKIVEDKCNRVNEEMVEWKRKMKTKNHIKKQLYDDISYQSRILTKFQEESQQGDVETLLSIQKEKNDLILVENKRLESKLRITLQNIQQLQEQNKDLRARLMLYNRENQ